MAREKARWKERAEYDVYVPTVDERGLPLDPKARNDARAELIDAFGGLTDMRHRNEGLWKVGGTTVRDEIVVWRVLGPAREPDDGMQGSDPNEAGDAVVERIAGSLRVALGQEALLVVKRIVAALE